MHNQFLSQFRTENIVSVLFFDMHSLDFDRFHLKFKIARMNCQKFNPVFKKLVCNLKVHGM